MISNSSSQNLKCSHLQPKTPRKLKILTAWMIPRMELVRGKDLVLAVKVGRWTLVFGCFFLDQNKIETSQLMILNCKVILIIIVWIFSMPCGYAQGQNDLLLHHVIMNIMKCKLRNTLIYLKCVVLHVMYTNWALCWN